VNDLRYSNLPDQELRLISIELGILWAYQVNVAKKAKERWVWFLISFDGSPEQLAFAPRDCSYVILPGSWIYEMITHPTSDNTIVLLYNMLLANNLPDAEPKSYTLLR
jgi:hypothetical protein